MNGPQGNDWMPLFSGNIVNPGLPSVQPNELTVTAPDQRSSSRHVFTNFPNTKLQTFSPNTGIPRLVRFQLVRFSI